MRTTHIYIALSSKKIKPEKTALLLPERKVNIYKQTPYPDNQDLRVFSGNRLDLEVLPKYIVLKAKTRFIFIRRRRWYHHLKW